MPYKRKQDQADCAKRHYLKNKDKIKARSVKSGAKARKANRDFVNNYLSKNPCVDCGFSDIRALEFDHIDRDEKLKTISQMISGGYSLGSLKLEIKKCEIRCANCHRIKTHETVWKK